MGVDTNDSEMHSGWRVVAMQAAVAILLFTGGLMLLESAPHIAFWVLVGGLISTLVLVADVVNRVLGAGRTRFTDHELLDDDSPSRGLWDSTSVYHDPFSE